MTRDLYSRSGLHSGLARTELARRYDAFLFDLDGVLFRGDLPIDGAARAVDRLRRLGRRVTFVTNNSSRDPEAVAAHLRRVGVVASVSEIETSALATARYLGDEEVSSAYVVGGEGLRGALADAGIEVADGEPEAVDAVVVGYDPSFDYGSMRVASALVLGGARLVASNADASYPAPDGGRWPGAGALVAAIEVASGTAATVVGKPHEPLLLAALERAGGGRPLVVGDRLDTDIEGARRLGWDSLLVLTGISGRLDVDSTEIRPTWIGDDLGVLFGDPNRASPAGYAGEGNEQTGERKDRDDDPR